MKKSLVVLMLVVLLVAMTACKTQTPVAPDPGPATVNEPATAPEPAAPDYKIGFSFPTTNNEFWNLSLENAKSAAKACGFELVATACDNDQAKQLSDVESMIAGGINGLVLAPQDASVCPGIVKMCKEKGLPLVIVDRWPGDELKAGQDFIAFIGPNDIVAGYSIAMSLIDAGCTKLVAINGFQGTSVADGRNEGLMKALAEHPEVELLQQEWPGENMEQGEAALRDMMQAHDDIDGVWCYNDSHALASVKVLKDAGKLASVKVGGMDLLGPAIESMKAGELWFSTGGHYMQSAFGAIVVFDTLNGFAYSGDPVIKLNLLNVSQENLSQFVKKYQESAEPVDWKNYSKVYNPDASATFELTL